MHWVRSPQFVELMVREATGASYPAVSDRIVKNSPIPIPPLSEQRRIAAILDKADALRRKRKRAIELLDSLTRSIFLEMFDDPTSNPQLWPVIKFANAARNESSKRVPIKSEDRDKRSGPFPYYGASGVIDDIDDYIFDGRRLLIAEDGANLISRSTPIAFFAEGKFWVNNHAHVLAENDNCNLSYLQTYIQLIDLKPYVTGSAQPKLNRANMDNIPVLLPPMDLQNHFEAALRVVQSNLALVNGSDPVLQKLSSSLQSRAFSGQL